VSEVIPPVEHLATLYEITRSLNSSLNLQEVLDYVMDRVIEVTGAERGFLMLLDRETDTLNFQVARGIDRKDLENPKFEVSRTIINEVRQTGKPLLTDNAQNQYAHQQSIVMMALRSILCVPIRVKEELIGIVYVDNRMHVGLFNQQHLELVMAFASQAGFAIENARLYRIAVEQGRMQRELEMAHNIQRGMLPVQFPVLPGYEVAVFWDSAREVAGDFYDCFVLDDANAMGIVIADVSDKGAPAAIFMAVTRSLMRGYAMVSSRSPMDILHNTNRMIMTDAASSGMFVTTYYCTFKPGGYAVGVNAGHNLPLIWRARSGAIEWLPRGGLPLGWFENIPLNTVEFHLDPGDVVVFYTDGLTEAENRQGDAFGEETLAEVVSRYAGKANAQELIEIIEGAVQEFIGDAPPFDDRTMVVVRYTGADR